MAFTRGSCSVNFFNGEERNSTYGGTERCGTVPCLITVRMHPLTKTAGCYRYRSFCWTILSFTRGSCSVILMENATHPIVRYQVLQHYCRTISPWTDYHCIMSTVTARYLQKELVVVDKTYRSYRYHSLGSCSIIFSYHSLAWFVLRCFYGELPNYRTRYYCTSYARTLSVCR
jgi:hypothetical protein